MEYLLFLDKKILFNKVGLILSYFVDDLLVTNSLLERMKSLGIKGVKYFTKEMIKQSGIQLTSGLLWLNS